MSQTRYQKQTFSPLPKQKRPQPIRRADSLSGRRWKCSFCGFVCDSQRDTTGDGVGFTATDIVDPGILQFGTGDKRDVLLSVDAENVIHLSRLDSEGDPIPTVGNFSQQTFAGCPMCGSKAYK